MHCAALRGPAVSLTEIVGALGNVSACRKTGKPFVKAALYTTSHAVATSQKYLLKNVTSYLKPCPLTVYEF